MQIDANSIIIAGKVIAAIIVIGGAAGSVYKWIVKPFQNASRLLKEYREKIDKIHHEVQPNGGGSLRDAVSSIKNTVARVEKRQRAWLSYENRGVFETDGKGDCMWLNRAFLQMLNTSMEEVLGRGWKNFIFPPDKLMVYSEWENCVQDGRDFKLNLRYMTSEGDPFNAHCEAFAIKNDKGEVEGYVGYVTNLDQEK